MVSLKRATTSCVVQKEKTQTRITFNNLSTTLTVNDLYKYVQLHLEEERPFQLSLVRDCDQAGGVALDAKSSLKVSLDDQRHKTLLAAGLCFENGAANTVILTTASNYTNGSAQPNGAPVVMLVPHEQVPNGHHASPNGIEPEAPQELSDFSRQITIDTSPQEDPAPLVSPIELSPKDPAAVVPAPPPLPALEYGAATATSTNGSLCRQLSPEPSRKKFVGLVNQAMTCYLNSLLQALFMTPEFRQAIYSWEFDGHDETKSIPYQLQRLFLNLQTSPKSAVETTALTRSFGWDSSDSWQQHDIQELCRVMFDALEHKFKNTTESNLINRLYEGKMVDYLKCLSCGTEKQREDTFLDIPLPVKPFGSQVAFESIEEALRAFIQPEILNGNNQYSCETCQKKCDAHKGLKFSQFPYILTLHLKRFDFDYQTFHRIKLNDKVTFPQSLNLNGFVNTATAFAAESAPASNGHGDESTAAEQGQVNGHAPADTDSEKPEKSTFGSHSGPYLYELFAIMIHSGSASGGHYYVYIKDFESGHWFCFNDQCVTPITQEDIQKSFGGNAGRYHYSGAYTTSTNAYMLMYRQLDPVRNKLPTPVADLPEHIQELQKRLQDRVEVDNRRRNNTDCSVITTRVYHYDRERCKLSDVKIHISGDYYLDELLQRAYDRMSLSALRSLSLCRLVAFDSRTEQTLASIDPHDQTLLQDVLDKYDRCDFLLEERESNHKFRSYTGSMLNTRVYWIDLESGDADGPYRVPVPLLGTVADAKREIMDHLQGKGTTNLRVALSKGNLAVILDNDANVLQLEIDPTELCPVKLFVTNFPDAAASRVEQFDRRMRRRVEHFDQVVSLYLRVPKLTPEARRLYSIPEYTPPTTDEPAAVIPAVKLACVREPSPENLLPTPGVLVAGSHVDSSTSSPSPEPSASAKSEVPEVKVKKKSLVPKADKAKEKSPVKIIETTKEVTENGVTKKVRVIRRITKKDPAKKAALLANGANGEATATDADSPTNTTKVFKKAKVTVSSKRDESAVSPMEKTPEIVVVDEPVPVEVVLPRPRPNVDPFLFLDSEESERSGKYFRAIPRSACEQNGSMSQDDTNRIQLHVEKSMTISALTACLEPVLRVSKSYFKINRSRNDTLRLSDLVSTLCDGDELFIELGRILQEGEFKYRVTHLKLSTVTDFTEELPFLCDFIVRNNQRVDQVKQDILQHLAHTQNPLVADQSPRKTYRLWTKLYQSLSQVCLDDLVLGDDVGLRKSGEFVLEEVEEGIVEPTTDCEDFVIFARKWNPDTLVLEPYLSVTLPLKSDLVQRLAERTGIPPEQLEYARNMLPFPKMKISRTCIDADMDWKTESISTSFENSRNGHVYFCRDKRVAAKETTPEEVAAIQQDETSQRDALKAAQNGSAGQNGASNDDATGSVDANTAAAKNRRKERALKIYLDSSPAKVST